MSKKKRRINIAFFDFPVNEIRRGYRSDVYFWRSKVILEEKKHTVRALMQVFQKKKSVLCGVDEALGVFKIGTGYYTDRVQAYKLFDRLIALKQELRTTFYQRNYRSYFAAVKERAEMEERLDGLWKNTFRQLAIYTLNDGDSITPWETVMTIEGDLNQFVHLETVYLGVLARRTKVATKVREVVEVAQGKPVLFFPARFDHWSQEGGDGYAAKIGGAYGVSTDAQASWWGERGMGTVPHALIAAYGGDTVKASEQFAEQYPGVNLIALVDFSNDVVKTSLEVARVLQDRLWGVRLDTSEKLIDKSLKNQKSKKKSGLHGVCKELVLNVRRALDNEGFTGVKIVVSGGFTKEKIRDFEKNKVPVDAYGVGSYLMHDNIDFTADVVKINGKHCAKTGRRYRPNPRLIREV